MSTRRISIVHKIDGVLTDYDSTPVLRDPTAAYGVKAVVAGTVIVAAGTAFTHDGTGLYSYTVTGLTVGLAYLAYVERVYAGATKRDAYPWTAGATNAAGRYATQSDVENIFGIQNVAVWSDMTSAATVDTNRVQLALDNADAGIDLFFRDGPYAVPLTAGTAGTVMLRRWAATLAGVWLYDNRGSKDDDKEGKIYARMLAGVRAEMGLYKSDALRLDAPRRWPSPSGPIAC